MLKDHAPVISEAEENLGDDASSDRLTKNRREIRSAYLVGPEYMSMTDMPPMLWLPVVFNSELVATYGFASLDVSLPVFIEKNQNMDFSTALTENNFYKMWTTLTWKLASWNNLNQYFLSGSKTIKLRPDIRIGQALLEKSPIRGDRYYYVESVHHVWDFEGENSYTELAVTRGLLRKTYDHPWFTNFLGQFLRLTRNLTGEKMAARLDFTKNPLDPVWPSIPDMLLSK
jgi:hypothetical protein